MSKINLLRSEMEPQLQQFGSLTICEQNVPCEIFTKFSWKISSMKIINYSLKTRPLIRDVFMSII